MFVFLGNQCQVGLILDLKRAQYTVNGETDMARESESCLWSRKWKMGQFQFEHVVVMPV